MALTIQNLSALHVYSQELTDEVQTEPGPGPPRALLSPPHEHAHGALQTCARGGVSLAGAIRRAPRHR